AGQSSRSSSRISAHCVGCPQNEQSFIPQTATSLGLPKNALSSGSVLADPGAPEIRIEDRAEGDSPNSRRRTFSRWRRRFNVSLYFSMTAARTSSLLAAAPEFFACLSAREQASRAARSTWSFSAPTSQKSASTEPSATDR